MNTSLKALIFKVGLIVCVYQFYANGFSNSATLA